MVERVSFLSEGLRIHATLNLSESEAPCVVMSHGLDSTGDGDDYPVLARLLAAEGIASLRITHRGCGRGTYASEGKGALTTLSGRITDLRASMEFLKGTGVDLERLGGMGTSFGGMVMLGAREPSLKACALIATPCTIPPLGTPGTNNDSPLHRDVARYDLLDAIRESRRPVLIVHGDGDTSVPVQNSHVLFQNARDPKRMEIIEGADHVFSQPEHRQRVNELCVQWFKTYLLGI